MLITLLAFLNYSFHFQISLSVLCKSFRHYQTSCTSYFRMWSQTSLFCTCTELTFIFYFSSTYTFSFPELVPGTGKGNCCALCFEGKATWGTEESPTQILTLLYLIVSSKSQNCFLRFFSLPHESSRLLCLSFLPQMPYLYTDNVSNHIYLAPLVLFVCIFLVQESCHKHLTLWLGPYYLTIYFLDINFLPRFPSVSHLWKSSCYILSYTNYLMPTNRPFNKWLLRPLENSLCYFTDQQWFNICVYYVGNCYFGSSHNGWESWSSRNASLDGRKMYHIVLKAHGNFYSSDLLVALWTNVIFMAIYCSLLFTFLVSFWMFCSHSFNLSSWYLYTLPLMTEIGWIL